MDQNNVIETFSSIASDKYIRRITIAVIVFAIAIGTLLSPVAGTIIILSYILGHIAAWFLIKHQNKTNFYLQKLLNYYQIKVSLSKRNIRSSCSVCDDLSCKRHQASRSVTPWKGLQVQKDLNEAVKHFYNRILDDFVTSWHDQFTDDPGFLNELKYCLKYASATLIKRLIELDPANIIANKLVPCAVKHVDDYLYMQQISKLKNVKFNDVVVEYLGKQLHIATVNREYELKYLQELCAVLLDNLLPETYVKCRNFTVLIREVIAGWVLLPLMDVISDPNIINSLVIVAVNYKSTKHSKQINNIQCEEFLSEFIEMDVNKKSPFATNLNRIKNNTELLYAFMQFLKKQEHVNLLQFCLDVDEFNSKLLTPDLTKKQLKELHAEALRLNKDYFDEYSPNFIHCSKELCDGFNYLIKDIYSVAKLRTSKPLYQAYDYTFNVLENVWLPQFFHSNEFYNYICGSNVTSTYKKAPIKSKKYYDQQNVGTVSKISSGLGKIKGVLKSSQPVDGDFYHNVDAQNLDNGTVDEIIMDDCKNLFRNLNSWGVTIPSYQVNQSNKVVYFYVNVQRTDIGLEDSKSKWYIWRKDQDFYTLKAKLVEFHGENEICDSPLPSRKAGSPIETRLQKYEDFIKKLLSKPTLRGSDLLYTFLTTEEDFTMLLTTMTPNVQDIGNIFYQSVAHKLRKEKGQHLDSFMTAFLNSTGKSKMDKPDIAEDGAELDTFAESVTHNIELPKTYKNHIFNDNFGLTHKPWRDTSSSSVSPSTLTECIFYLLKNIFRVSQGILKMYVAICSVSQQLVEFLLKLFIDRKLRTGLSQSNLAYLIGLLEDVIFTSHISPTREELDRRRVKAKNDIKRIFPNWINSIVGVDMSNGGTELLELLQNPHYNKQLAYNLIDLILIEVFPQFGGKTQ